jgi:TatD DNase family protein
MEEFDNDRDEVIEKAFKAGVRAILCPAEITDKKNLNTTFVLTKKYSNIIAAAGAHPHQAKKFTPENAAHIKTLAETKQIHAIGEIGLDFFYNHSSSKQQIIAFRKQLNIAQKLKQLNIAQKLKLPAVIHSRSASDEIISAIKEENFTCGGVLHCFTEDWEFARQVLKLGFFISFSGILTFPRAHSIREAARKITLDKLLVETDSPFLTPVPYRGKIKRNEPVYVKETAKFLAELKNISFEEVAAVTSRNFKTCFGLK